MLFSALLFTYKYRTIYDSVWIVKNDLLNDLDLNDESVRYTILAPDNAAFEAMFREKTEYLESVEREVTKEDTVKWVNWMMQASLHSGVVDFQPNSSLRSVLGKDVRTDYQTVLDPVEMSNGRVYPMSRCYVPRSVYFESFWFNPYFLRKEIIDSGGSITKNPGTYDSYKSTINNANSRLVPDKLAVFLQYTTNFQDNYYQFKSCTYDQESLTNIPLSVMPGKYNTVVYTGDIHAMWLRDSGAQVWPYLQLANRDEHLRGMLAGVIRRQMKCIELDPYANAFLDPYDPNPDHQWMKDKTQMRPELHERKWEIDSLCYPLRLAYEYWKVTGDTSVFDEHWLAAVRNILRTFREQQRKEGVGPYTFRRRTERQLDTVCNDGKGNPVKPVGLIASVFRPSDDATTFLFLVPSNFFAVTSLRKASEILTKVNGEKKLAAECTALASEVETALRKYAVCDHPDFGKIYAFEVDGYGNRFLMDDANVPSLLAMPYLGDMDVKDPIYQNTRRFVWSTSNPYFFRGTAAEGIGGPHVGYDMAWPMSIMMKAFTSTDDAEIKRCVEMLMTTDAGTGFMHESFDVNDPNKFTRSWFAWQNTLFGELILKLVNEGKTDLLNSITVQ